MRENSIEQLKNSVKGTVLVNEPMNKHTSFHIGGPAEIFCIPSDIEDIKNIIIWSKRNRLPVTPVGNGTNLLVSDSGIEGVVIKLSDQFGGISFDSQYALVKSGSSVKGLISSAMERGLGGIEFAWGIPGAIGGSIAMNAGTNSHFLSKFVKKAHVIDLSGKEHWLSHDALKFDYRHSILQDEPLILLDVLFMLEEGKPDEIKKHIKEATEKRKGRQPLEYPCAGSVFKNPPTTYAGKVLEEAKCKGLRVGDAMISELHANFIINLGHATASDVIKLIRIAQERVYREKDLILDLEIKLMGKFNPDLLMKKK
jgi:UDP-N-acetylmuramate dehydrogenase